MGRDDDDPLFLQVKEAQPSVLAHHLDPATTRNQGERVVAGQRIMQATGDIFLGWQRMVGLDGADARLLRPPAPRLEGLRSIVEQMVPRGLRLYARLCAWTLARAHARSGDRIAIAAYLGDDDEFVEAVADFAEAYADLNEQDHAAFASAVESGELTAGEPAFTP